MTTRKKTIGARVTTTDKAAIRRAAKAAHESISRLMRKKLRVK